MSAGISKEGWLIKNGQKRWFVLTEDILAWLTHPVGDTKGTLELKNYTVEVNSKPESPDISKEVILKPKNSDCKEYRIGSKDAADVDDWARAFEKVIKYRCLLSSADAPLTKQGWLEKKGKKRWFLLKDDVLYWFDKEQLINSDFKKQCNGKLDLVNCTLNEGPPGKIPKHSTTFNFTISCAAENESYTLTAKTETDLSEWMSTIRSSIEKAKKSLSTRRQTLAKAENNMTEKKGYLQKKGKKRFFVLKDSVLYWYASDKQMDKLKGKLALAGCTIELSQKNNTIAVKNPNGKSYEVTAGLVHEFEEWYLILQHAVKSHRPTIVVPSTTNNKSDQSKKDNSDAPVPVEKRGWLLKKDQRRYFILKNEILSWFTQEQPAQPNFQQERGHITLNKCEVSRDFDEFSFCIKTSVAKSFHITGKTVAEVIEWVQAIEKGIAYASSSSVLQSPRQGRPKSVYLSDRKGWLEKKGKRRYFVLTDDSLRWLDGDTQTAKMKGSLSLAGCVVNQLSQSFLVASPQGESYTLTASSESESEQWVTWLQEAIFKANKLFEVLQMKGWLEKKGQRRWFVLKNGKLLWFSGQQSFDDITEENANNCLELAGSSVSLSKDDTCNFSIETPADKKSYVLRAQTENEAREWVQVLSKPLLLKTASTGKGKCFGIPLADVEKNEEGIPVILVSLITYLTSENRINSEGIFRLSGAADTVAEMRETFDRGVPFDPSRADINASATLLKAFLRDLPVPLFPFEFYKPLLHARNLEAIEAILLQLPEHNKKVLKYLFNFIRQVSEHSDVNHMNASNLAIVFGPNLLRTKELDMMAGLSDTPLILSAIRTLIQNYSLLFESL